jgi:hypothetical protein
MFESVSLQGRVRELLGPGPTTTCCSDLWKAGSGDRPKGVPALGTSPRFPRNSHFAGTDEAAAQAVGSAPATSCAECDTAVSQLSFRSIDAAGDRYTFSPRGAV